MKSLLLTIITIFLLTGCATTTVSKLPEATYQTKQQLYKDLKTGKLKIGTTLEYIKSTYGKPESITHHEGKTLVIYRRPAHNDSAYLWFNANGQLESWSH